MSRVREQGEAAGEQTADDLGHREGGGEGEDDRHRPAALAPGSLVRVFVRHGAILPPRGRGQPSRYWRSASQRPKAIWAAPRRRM
jgi:hypothetical protein